MVKVLKALAEFEGLTLGQLLEKIVLHSFEPVPGQEGEMSASPHSRRALDAIADFKRITRWTSKATSLDNPNPLTAASEPSPVSSDGPDYGHRYRKCPAPERATSRSPTSRLPL